MPGMSWRRHDERRAWASDNSHSLKRTSHPTPTGARATFGPSTRTEVLVNIELKGIKYAAFASEETNCFSATLYIDGVKCGTVSNEGHGGPDNFSDHAAEKRLNEYAKTLPPVTWQGHTLNMSAELIVGDLFEKWQKDQAAAKERKKLENDLKVRLLWTKKGEKGIYQTGKMEPAKIKAYLINETAWRAAKPEIDVILNALPFDKAWPVYDANIQRVAV
jgi:hypothetical protein